MSPPPKRPLGGLDDALLPSAARLLQRAAAAARAAVRRRTGPGTLAGEAARHQPTLLVAIAAVLAAACLLAAFGGDDRGPDRDSSTANSTAPVGAAVFVSTVGPAPRTRVADYLAAARTRLRARAATAHPTALFAVVDFTSYRTPAATARLLGHVEVDRVYARTGRGRIAAIGVHAIPLQGELRGLGEQLAASGRIATATAHEFMTLVRSIHGHTAASRTLRRNYERQAHAAAFDGRMLGRGRRCGCVFAAVVHALPDALVRLAARPGVRVVDPADPRALLASTTVLPLQPQDVQVVSSVERSGG